ncbi:hypothetical protein KC367_g4757 [Hortaea werneckii]|nr:hypothetical protein KC342_g5841 [Hortaea werneckii]KAI7099949.1 hypothetical protein KC339_g7849 [Hortaea werneckii]KAI7232601.1 hypothetical protein KC365_g6709 [Hortaea werneckii]KAI7312813.1 hypothetical protein KC340_g9745 [Hortaea werneckii]KAI7342738.1 hypothetical protein KC354_g16115 [Hortaea werneckii]
MGKAYSEAQRTHVRGLLEAGRDEESIEKETGVSDRTIRRWKLELERTGRIGKPPESRTGRHRVLSAEIEAALFDHVRGKPDMSVDDMLWWLYDTYKIVVGTRTIRRVFERKGDKVTGGKGSTSARGSFPGPALADDSLMQNEQDHHASPVPPMQYQSPYAPMQTTAQSAEQQLAQALQQQTPQTPYPTLATPQMEPEPAEDEETIQLQLQQIALQKREVELKLKMRRLQQGKGTPSARNMDPPPTNPSVLFNPDAAAQPQPPKRDSRSKKKIEESKRRTAERQERMLRDLERRSRRRDHLTAEWVQSKDIWPLRAQGLLADLMHQYGCYVYSPQSEQTFNDMYTDLYQLVDLSKGDWVPQIHDEMLRERMKRKMGQLRAKMQKTGEIVGRNDAFGGWQKAENYTGEAAGAALGDESEIQPDLQQATAGMQPPPDDQHLAHHPQAHHHPPPSHSTHQPLSSPSQIHYDLQPQEHHHPHHHHPHHPHHHQPPPGTLDPHQQHPHAQMSHHHLSYGAPPPPPQAMMQHPTPGQYPQLIQHHPGILGPYNLEGSQHGAGPGPGAGGTGGHGAGSPGGMGQDAGPAGIVM